MNTKSLYPLARHFSGLQDVAIYIDGSVSAPSTDGRTIYLPQADYDPRDTDALLASLLHEARHIHDTFPLLTQARLEHLQIQGGLARDLLNVLEDIRIDRRAMAAYPGARYLLQRGLQRALPPPFPEPMLVRVLKHLILRGEGFADLGYDAEAQGWVASQWPALASIIHDYEAALNKRGRWNAQLSQVKQCLERLTALLADWLDTTTLLADLQGCIAAHGGDDGRASPPEADNAPASALTERAARNAQQVSPVDGSGSQCGLPAAQEAAVIVERPGREEDRSGQGQGDHGLPWEGARAPQQGPPCAGDPLGSQARRQAIEAVARALADGTLPSLGAEFGLHLLSLEQAVERGILRLQHVSIPDDTTAALRDLLQARVLQRLEGETGRLNPRVLPRLPFDAHVNPFLAEEKVQVEAARLIFVLDASSSMRGRHSEPSHRTKAELVADCLVTLGHLFEDVKQAGSDVDWALIAFARDAKVIRPFGASLSPEEVAHQYVGWSQGATWLWGGLADAHRLLDQEDPQSRAVVVVLTDAALGAEDVQRLSDGLRPDIHYLFLTIGTARGHFADPEIQALYERLFHRRHCLRSVGDLPQALAEAIEESLGWVGD